MLIAFQGGNINAEVIDSALYFKVRDLLTTVGALSGKSNNFYKIVAKYINIEYYNFSEYTYKFPKYIHQNDVISFLDNIHNETKMQTILFMHEFALTFNKE